MPFPTAADERTGVPVSRLTAGDGIHLLPYYTARCLSADERFVCCTRRRDGIARACVVDLAEGSTETVSAPETGVLDESVAFHPRRPLLAYGSPDAVYLHNLETREADTLFRCSPGFRVKSEISMGNTHAVFWIYESLAPGETPMAESRGAQTGIGAFHLRRNCRSYVLAADLETGRVHAVWGDTAPLTHPVIDPTDDATVLFANQGTREHLQELFTMPLHGRDNAKPRKLYHTTDQRPVYVGHSFFTFDGWVGTQLIEFGGERPDGSLADMVDCNAVIRPDGRCDRRARCPGGNKPVHCHAARADGWWVGDTLPREGLPSESHMLCIMKNNWETGYSQAEPLAAHGCSHARPCHVHPRFTPDETRVLFNSDYRDGCHVYMAHVEEYVDTWTDRVPFGPRPYRHGNAPPAPDAKPPAGPEA